MSYCSHSNHYWNVISTRLKFWVCEDCGADLGSGSTPDLSVLTKNPENHSSTQQLDSEESPAKSEPKKDSLTDKNRGIPFDPFYFGYPDEREEDDSEVNKDADLDWTSIKNPFTGLSTYAGPGDSYPKDETPTNENLWYKYYLEGSKGE